MSGPGIYLPAHTPPSSGSPAEYDLHNARRRMMTETKDALLPCPFCGGGAEMDTMRGYRKLTNGVIDNAVAVYCTVCSTDMTMCYADHTGLTLEDMIFAMREAWNRRTPSPEGGEDSAAAGAGSLPAGHTAPTASTLREALKPFAAIADTYDKLLTVHADTHRVSVALGECRVAREALSQEGDK